MPYTVVQFTLPLTVGDVMHRMAWPMEALATLPEFNVIHVQHMSPYSFQLAFEADLVVVCMVWDLDLMPILRWRRAHGKPTVFEVNDYVFDLHPWNPSFESWNNPATQDDSLYIMAMADLVQTSTPFLAEAFKPYCSRVAVFPTRLAKIPEGLPKKPERPLVVGWGGSEGHMHDVACVAPAVSKWVSEHDGVELRIMGTEGIANLFTVPPAKKRYIPWGGMEAYEDFLKGVHMGLAPLRDTPYNRGRSDVKFLEYSAHGCVFVGQRLPTYTGSVEDGRTGFLFDDNAELVRTLDRLYADRPLGEAVRQAAFEYVKDKRCYGDHIQERAAVYKELLTGRSPTGGAGSALDGISRFPRVKLPAPLPDYVAVRTRPQEDKALTDLYSDRPDIPEASVRAVEERYGEYHLTDYSRGVMAFVRGDLATAERDLRRSIAFYPAAVRSLCLLGQLLLATRRPQEAREVLAAATQWNPQYMFVYPHLVSAAEMMSDWAGALAAADLWERNRHQDPRARMRRGLTLVRAGRAQEGIAAMREALVRFKERMKYWQLPYGAELVRLLRDAEPQASKEPVWSDLVLEAAEMFPYGLWLASRAGQICFERGQYERGARLLSGARERLLALEWQMREGVGSAQDHRRVIEVYRLACEDLAEEAPTRPRTATCLP